MEKYQKNYTKGIFVGLACNADCSFCNAKNGFGYNYGFINLSQENTIDFKSNEKIKEEIKNLKKRGVKTIIYESNSFLNYPNFEEILDFSKKVGFKGLKYYFPNISPKESKFLNKMGFLYGIGEILFSKKQYGEVKDIYGFNFNNFINFNKIKDKLDDYKNQGVQCVVYEGGDFSIYPKIFEVLEYGYTLGLTQTFQTNGIRLSDIEYVKKLKKYGIKDINFSLHSYRKETSNKMMGIEKGFEKTIEGIQNCTNLGITVSQNIVITKDNVNDLDWIILLALKLKIDLMSFILFIPPEDKINDIKYIEKYLVDPIEVGKKISKGLKFLSQVEKKAKTKFINIKFHNIPLCLLQSEQYSSREYIFDIFRKKGEGDYTLGTGFYKKEECSKCLLNSSCTGITQYYVEKYGDNYIIPIV